MQSAAEVVAVTAKAGWSVRGVSVTDGTYGCESGCEFWSIVLTLADGTEEQIDGDFGCVSGDRVAIEAHAREIADRLGVPMTGMRELWG